MVCLFAVKKLPTVLDAPEKRQIHCWRVCCYVKCVQALHIDTACLCDDSTGN